MSHSLLPQSPPPSQTRSSIVALPSVPDTQFPFYGVVVPAPIEIQAPCAGIDPEGFWVITVGQEVGIFYVWADVAVRTNYISTNIQKSYPSFQKALEAYTTMYNEGRVRAVPIPGGPFWPSPPSPTSSSTSDDLWSQVEDLSDTMSNCELPS
ncbi:hypothetical protein EDB19DRAFT_1627488 [Suillus lakei]|nr:hypothetical protein EDB19DRAFT_1627488 [Suillus lakei]